MTFIPDRGDLIWLHFDPRAGHEQTGHRPGLVLTPSLYNDRAGLAIICPIMTRIKGYPFEVVLPPALPIQGAILADQARSLDWRARKASLIAKVPDSILDDVKAKLEALLFP